MAKKFAPIRKTKASDLIVEEIWSSILNGELKPGDRLPPERELVQQFNVSKVTLREALQTLEANGYIERKRGVTGGSIVLELAPTKGIDLICEYLNAKGLDIEDVISTRLILDPLISESVARTIKPEEADQLTLLIEKHKKEFDRTGKSKFGWHFEQYLAKLTGNKMLIVFVDLLMQLVINFENTRFMRLESIETNKTGYCANIIVTPMPNTVRLRRQLLITTRIRPAPLCCNTDITGLIYFGNYAMRIQMIGRNKQYRLLGTLPCHFFRI